MLRFADTEYTREFDQHHSDLVLKKYHDRYVMGALPTTVKFDKVSLFVRLFVCLFVNVFVC